jgi:ribosomal protein S18 acetylase RimI-like enzyme
MLPWQSRPEPLSVRPVRPEEAQSVWQLLQTSRHSHLRPEWRLHIAWIGEAPALVAERPYGLVGCLITPADPPPAAWVSAAAVLDGERPLPVMRTVLLAILDILGAAGIATLACMPTEPWLPPILERLDFAVVEQVTTWEKPDLHIARQGAPDILVRPVAQADMDPLAQIEAAAFPPRWRHSARTLALAWAHSATFTVAERKGLIVGYQFSVLSGDWAHLVRITVDPAHQRTGVAARLLADALARYGELGARHVSLNTQSDNLPSQHLYSAFGFREVGLPISVWERPV